MAKRGDDVLAESVLEHLAGAALALDDQLRIQTATPSARAVLGFDVPLGTSAATLLCGDRPKRPFAEALAGVLMMAGALMWVSIPVALFIGGIGAVSVFKAVYIDKRELKCACVGGDSNVPLGFVSLTENLMMIGMAVWMIFKPMGLGH